MKFNNPNPSPEVSASCSKRVGSHALNQREEILACAPLTASSLLLMAAGR